MERQIKRWASRLDLLAVLLVVGFCCQTATAQGLIPGTGQVINEVGDDFEDPEWVYHPNVPKVANQGDETLSKNLPGGVSENKRWYEGMKRGQPDFVQRVATPAGGLAGSSGAIAIRSFYTGSSRPSYRQQQEDFVADVVSRIGKVPVSRGPSVVTRVWMPPIDQWENRTGCHFAFRVSLETSPRTTSGGLFRSASTSFDGLYFPGIFVNLNSKQGNRATGGDQDVAYFWMKATADSRKIQGPQITTTGWWTLGISITPDGQVHYYAKPGVAELTAADHLASSYPFGHRALRMRTFFFNVCNGDDAKNWSTQFVIDDTKMHLAR